MKKDKKNTVKKSQVDSNDAWNVVVNLKGKEIFKFSSLQSSVFKVEDVFMFQAILHIAAKWADDIVADKLLDFDKWFVVDDLDDEDE